MRSFLSSLLVLLGMAGCIVGHSAGISFEAPPVPIEPPVPLPFKGDVAPTLVPTQIEGLQAAPELDPTLYFYEPYERWYRYAFNRWYEAFLWDGHWFPAERVPHELEWGSLRPAATP